MKIVSRAIVAVILLFNLIVLIGAAMRSLGDVVHRPAGTNVAQAAFLLALSFALGVWFLGLSQSFVAVRWPERFRKNLLTKWRHYLAAVLVGAGLFMLFGTPIGRYAQLGMLVGTSLAELALRQISGVTGIDLPKVLIQIVGWEFHLLYASLMVGFCVWVVNASRGALKKDVKSAEQSS